MEKVFTVITSSNMPYGHEAHFNLLLNAQYGRSATEDFTLSYVGSNASCSSGSQDCSDNDKFMSVILYKTSAPSLLLINNTNTACSSTGYQDFTNIFVTLEPGQQYTIKVKCGYSSQQVGGWFDLNGNNSFENNEKLITLSCSTANAEYTQNFTIPTSFEPGAHRFRLITKYAGTPTACDNSSWGQTHDYTIVLPELYPLVQNVVAVLDAAGGKITTTWDAPTGQTPIGYNIYRAGIKLNPTPLTSRTYTETNLAHGVYAYHVTAIYSGNKESIAKMSNVICYYNTNVNTYEIVASAGENGTINPSGIVTVTQGNNQTFNFLPANCYEINQVLVDGAPVSISGSSYTFTNVMDNHNISVTFKLKTYTITATTGANGTITPIGVTTVNCGASLTYTFTPASCYEINQVLVNGVNNTTAVAAGAYTFNNVTANQTISVTFKLKTYTINATAGANGTISPNGATTVNCGANQTFTFTPASCYEINQVLVNGVNNPAAVLAGSYTFNNVTANQTISVSFKLKTYTITATTGANGTITPIGATTVNCGANQTFTITPANGYEINQVLVNGVNNPAAVAAGSYTFVNVTANQTISVTFKVATPTYTITATAGANGNIAPSGAVTVTQGNNQTFTFTPANCYEIDVVTVDGAPASISGNSYTFTNVNAAHTINVTFKKIQYSITATAGANGTISSVGVNAVGCGENKTFTFTPNSGYVINQVLVNGVNNLAAVAAGAYTFNNVTTNHTISVTFKEYTFPYTITATAGAGGTITPSGTIGVDKGATLTFTFAAGSGYKIASVMVDGKNQQSAINSGNYTFKNISGNHTIHVTFSSTIFTIVASSGPNGSINPSGTITVNQGGSQTFTFTPMSGYSIEKVLVDGAANNGATNSGSYKFNNINASHTISVTFKLGKLDIEENIENNVSIYGHLNSVYIINESDVALKSVEIFDVIGRSIYQNSITDTETIITLNVASGIYFVKIISETNYTFINKVVLTND
jgi:hypothetical protein